MLNVPLRWLAFLAPDSLTLKVPRPTKDGREAEFGSSFGHSIHGGLQKYKGVHGIPEYVCTDGVSECVCIGPSFIHVQSLNANGHPNGVAQGHKAEQEDRDWCICKLKEHFRVLLNKSPNSTSVFQNLQ